MTYYALSVEKILAPCLVSTSTSGSTTRKANQSAIAVKRVSTLHMEKKDFPRVTLVFEDGKWVGAHKMILAASSWRCAAAWQKKASAATDLYEGNSEQYFGGI